VQIRVLAGVRKNNSLSQTNPDRRGDFPEKFIKFPKKEKVSKGNGQKRERRKAHEGKVLEPQPSEINGFDWALK